MRDDDDVLWWEVQGDRDWSGVSDASREAVRVLRRREWRMSEELLPKRFAWTLTRRWYRPASRT